MKIWSVLTGQHTMARSLWASENMGQELHSSCWALPTYRSTWAAAVKLLLCSLPADNDSNKRPNKVLGTNYANTWALKHDQNEPYSPGQKEETRWQGTAFNPMHRSYYNRFITRRSWHVKTRARHSRAKTPHRSTAGAPEAGAPWYRSTKAPALQGVLDGREVLFASLGVGLHRPLPRLPSGRADLVWVLLDVLQRLMKHWKEMSVLTFLQLWPVDCEIGKGNFI